MTVPTGVPLEPAVVYPRSVTKLRSAVTPDGPQLPVEHRQTLPVTALGSPANNTAHFSLGNTAQFSSGVDSDVRAPLASAADSAGTPKQVAHAMIERRVPPLPLGPSYISATGACLHGACENLTSRGLLLAGY